MEDNLLCSSQSDDSDGPFANTFKFIVIGDK